MLGTSERKNKRGPPHRKNSSASKDLIKPPLLFMLRGLKACTDTLFHTWVTINNGCGQSFRRSSKKIYLFFLLFPLLVVYISNAPMCAVTEHTNKPTYYRSPAYRKPRPFCKLWRGCWTTEISSMKSYTSISKSSYIYIYITRPIGILWGDTDNSCVSNDILSLLYRNAAHLKAVLLLCVISALVVLTQIAHCFYALTGSGKVVFFFFFF